ncbi:MAG: hypothetical protein LBQ21_04360 [Clostridiales Family XIII bacterium]|nr:hypothetical protein [Clostridiales Family XIII bacterium]
MFHEIREYFETTYEPRGSVRFEYAKGGASYDVLLLLNGCTNRCAHTEAYDFGDRLVSVWEPGQTKRAIAELEAYAKDIAGDVE